MQSLKRKPRRNCPIYLLPEERDGLRLASRFNAQLMDYIRPQVRPGVKTIEIDRLAHAYTLDHGHRPATLGYKGYSKSCCTSVNEVVCHGIPGEQVLQPGDIVNVDFTSIVNGWYGDSSETILVGDCSDEARHVTQAAFDGLWLGIRAVQPYCKVTEIGRAIERMARQRNLEVVREYQGHGLGREFHQDPGIPHYVPRLNAPQDVLEPGMCFTIEPMINVGTWRTFIDEADHWTVRTADLRLSAQFEHTILLTEDGPEVLTQTTHGPREGHVF